MRAVTEGLMSTGVPYLRMGEGPPLLVASGLTTEHTNPTGLRRRSSLTWMAPFAEHFTVYLCNRRPGLALGSTMAEIAADYAGAIEQDLGGPVFLHGTSTGGSVALQLACDRPDLVQRLVVSAAACRLSDQGRRVQAELAQLTRRGDSRGAGALIAGTLASGWSSHAARGIGWLAGPLLSRGDPADMLVVIDAEDRFDAEPRLERVRAPALVLGGTADAGYSEELFRRTALGMPNGRAVILPGKSHMYVAGSPVTAGIALGFLLG